MKPWSGVIGEDNVEVQRVAAVGASGGEFWFLTPPTLHAYEFDWAPDPLRIAFVATDPPGENNLWVAKLYTRNVDPPWVATGQPSPSNGDCLQLRSILDPTAAPGPLHGLQIAAPRWSPDGKQIAFIGGLMSDQGSPAATSTSSPPPASSPATNPRT